MTAGGFQRYELRTTDVVAARAFYGHVLAIARWSSVLDVTPLPEVAIARGARPHWLGHLGVADPEASADALVRRGGARLGPAARSDGTTLVRDAEGVLVALARAAPADATIVAWHHLNTPDAERSLASLRALADVEVRESGPSPEPHRLFAWARDAPVAGSVTTIADPTRTHAYWYFFFRVADLDAALARVRARGGITLDPVIGSDGARLAPCDDPQGAAFGLYEARVA